VTIDIVFFDAGGTILDPHPSFPELFALTCAAHGFEVEVEKVSEVQERIAPHLVELLAEAGLEHGPTLSVEASHRFWTFTYTRFLAELGITDPDMPVHLYETFSSPSSYRLYDDVRPAFDALEDAGYRLGLISNFDSWLQKMLVEMEVGHVFDTAIISGLVGIEKPDPAIYRLAVERAGVDPARAVHVGDSPVMDIEPARTAGLTPVLLDRAGRYPDAPHARLADLTGLLPLVSKL
jgi:putative hydrolase of the HAD superfamily